MAIGGLPIRTLGEWYTLKIEVQGDNLLLHVDDALVFETREGSNTSGGVALWAYDSIIEYDNIVVTGDDISDMGPSGYAVEPEAKLTSTWGWLKN